MCDGITDCADRSDEDRRLCGKWGRGPGRGYCPSARSTTSSALRRTLVLRGDTCAIG